MCPISKVGKNHTHTHTHTRTHAHTHSADTVLPGRHFQMQGHVRHTHTLMVLVKRNDIHRRTYGADMCMALAKLTHHTSPRRRIRYGVTHLRASPHRHMVLALSTITYNRTYIAPYIHNYIQSHMHRTIHTPLHTIAHTSHHTYTITYNRTFSGINIT